MIVIVDDLLLFLLRCCYTNVSLEGIDEVLLFFLSLPLGEKNFVLASPSLSHVILDRCLALLLSIAANPRILAFNFLTNSLSTSEKCQFSCAASNCPMASLQTTKATLYWEVMVLAHTFSAFAVLASLMWSLARELCCSGICLSNAAITHS
jgi:hypothetical protein